MCPVYIFKKIKIEEIYIEIAKESKKIYRPLDSISECNILTSHHFVYLLI